MTIEPQPNIESVTPFRELPVAEDGTETIIPPPVEKVRPPPPPQNMDIKSLEERSREDLIDLSKEIGLTGVCRPSGRG